MSERKELNAALVRLQAKLPRIAKGATAGSQSAAAQTWAQADQDVMKDAPFYPITQPLQPLYHASYVHNAIYVPALQAFDPTNVWLSSPGS